MLIERKEAKLLHINGFKRNEGEYGQFLVRTKDNKPATMLDIDGNEVSMIYKKLINGEWLEIPESSLPEGIKYTELEKTLRETEKYSVRLESMCLNLDTILAITSVMERACDGKDEDFSIMLRDINNKIYKHQCELNEIADSLILNQ